MPIVVKDYKWSETQTEVVLVVPLKGVKAAKADIFTTNEYIKVNYPPYLFEVHLFESVVEEKCNVKVGNGVIEFRLAKQEEREWGQLMRTVGREDMVGARERAVLASQLKEKSIVEERAKKKREEEQYAIREQMKLEQEKREAIAMEKQGETKKAMDELEIWKESHSVTTPVTATDIWSGKTLQAPPPPRTGGKIVFSFTPRPFTTAARESKIPEEEEWLRKMAAARRIQPSQDGGQIPLNDRNPEFVKDKANQMFRVGNYTGAIEVLSGAIQLNPNLPYLFANRAACHLQTGNSNKAIQDCSRALELYYPPVPSNYTARAKVFARRGTAYSNIGELALALQDYSAAVKLSPDNVTLQRDYEQLMAVMGTPHDR